jgi:prevent-host-death family protein
MNIATWPPGVGVRELRDHLSKYLAEVKEGREIVVTDHGRPIARLVPPEPGRSKLAQLIAEGRAQPPQTTERRRFQPIKLKDGGSISDIVIEQRRR